MQKKENKFFKILIADDNVQYRNTMATRLRLQGLHIEISSGGFHLLNIIENAHDFMPIVIIHEDLSDMSALECILLIRTSKEPEKLPIIFISKDNSKEKIDEIISNGANEYFIESSVLQPIVESIKKVTTQLKLS